jgi:hypothetical protein
MMFRRLALTCFHCSCVAQGDDTIDAESGSSGKKFGSFGGSNQTGMRVVSTMMQNVEDEYDVYIFSGF